MSLSPQDMDFLEAKHTAAREIALAFGVPPMLLAFPATTPIRITRKPTACSSRQTVLPLAARIGCALTQWLSPAFGEASRLAVDTDRIDALAADRAALWERVNQAPFLSVNEKRIAIGYAPVEGGDVFHSPQ